MEKETMKGFVIKGSSEKKENRVKEWWIGLNRYQAVKIWEEEYQDAEKLRGESGLRKAKKISLETERYCNKYCEDHSNLSPMATCLGLNCSVWKIKNKTLSLKKLLESKLP